MGIMNSSPARFLQTSRHLLHASGIPEQLPPKEGGKQEPLIDPVFSFWETIWTEQPLFSLQLYKHWSLSPVTSGTTFISCFGASGAENKKKYGSKAVAEFLITLVVVWLNITYFSWFRKVAYIVYHFEIYLSPKWAYFSKCVSFYIKVMSKIIDIPTALLDHSTTQECRRWLYKTHPKPR